jgi:hypothetical protein
VDLDPEILIEFQYNPTEISDRRGATYASQNLPGLLMPVRQYIHGGDRTLSFTVKLDGRLSGVPDAELPIALGANGDLTPELNKYRALLWPQTPDWQMAGASFANLYGEETLRHVSPPVCRFGWGERVIDCVVTGADITEQLFNSELAPLRAEVRMTLVERLPYDVLPLPVI